LYIIKYAYFTRDWYFQFTRTLTDCNEHNSNPTKHSFYLSVMHLNPHKYTRIKDIFAENAQVFNIAKF